MASFACVQALINAVRTRDGRFIAQIIGVEMFTIFFEVMSRIGTCQALTNVGGFFAAFASP